jgi:hypothetical protein
VVDSGLEVADFVDAEWDLGRVQVWIWAAGVFGGRGDREVGVGEHREGDVPVPSWFLMRSSDARVSDSPTTAALVAECVAMYGTSASTPPVEDPLCVPVDHENRPLWTVSTADF